MILGRLDVFICLQKFFGDVVSIEESAEGASPSGTREWRARERSDPREWRARERSDPRASPASPRATRRAHSDPDTPSDVEGKTRGRPDPAVKSARVCDACAGSCAARATRSTTGTTWGPRPRARLSSTTPSRRYVHDSTRTTPRPEPVANGPPSRPAPRPRGE